MMQDLIKFKHHLLFLAALLIANYIIEPLWQNQTELKSKANSIENRVNKVEHLITQKELLEIQQGKIQLNLFKFLPLLYKQKNEAVFKLTAQTAIETSLKEANCEVEQIGWQGSESLSNDIRRWQLDARFKGGPSCLLTAARELESLKPIVRVNDYFYGGRRIDSDPSSIVRAQLELVMWQYLGEESL